MCRGSCPPQRLKQPGRGGWLRRYAGWPKVKAAASALPEHKGETSPLDQSWREKSLTKPGGKPQSGSLSPTLVGCAGDGDCQSVRSGRRFRVVFCIPHPRSYYFQVTASIPISWKAVSSSKCPLLTGPLCCYTYL